MILSVSYPSKSTGSVPQLNSLLVVASGKIEKVFDQSVPPTANNENGNYGVSLS